MRNNLIKTYKEEMNKIKQNSGVNAIFLVGSSKDKDFKKDAKLINDIDLFVICDNIESQMRIIKEVDGISFDINYFSEENCKEMVKNREKFFINEIRNAKVEYDNGGFSQCLIKICEQTYNKGPVKLQNSEKYYIKYELHSTLNKLKNKDNMSELEYDFLTNLFLKDIIIGYFSINDKWLPKEKKLIKALNKEDIEFYKLIENAYKFKGYEELKKTYLYVFKDEDRETFIKLIY